MIRLRTSMPARSLGTLTSISKVKINHPPLPHGTMLVYYQTGWDIRKHFLLRFFYDISLNHQHCFRGKGAEVAIFFMKGMKDIKCSVNCWVFQVLLPGIVLWILRSLAKLNHASKLEAFVHNNFAVKHITREYNYNNFRM